MKFKFNSASMLDPQHPYSVHDKTPKYVEWVHDFSGDITLYYDNNIILAFRDNVKGVKYAWLVESPILIKSIIEDIKNNLDKYFSVFKFIFTHNKELLDLDNRFKFVPGNGTWITEPKMYGKTRLISMISSNKTFTYGHNERLKWVSKLQNDLDLYGRGFREIEKKEEALCEYMFSVTIENAFEQSYFQKNF